MITSCILVSWQTARTWRFPAGRFGGHFEFVPWKTAKTMGVQHRSIFSSCSDEHIPPLEIIRRLKEYHGEGPLSQWQVYFGLTDISVGGSAIAREGSSRWRSWQSCLRRKSEPAALEKREGPPPTRFTELP
jgi:hypothetical protein